MKGAAAAIVVAMAVAYLAVTPTHALTCGDVDACVLPCVGYLTGREAAPPGDCCAGVRLLRTLPTDTTERRFACGCVKKAAARVNGLRQDAIRGLPAVCGVSLPFPLSLDFDCSVIP